MLQSARNRAARLTIASTSRFQLPPPQHKSSVQQQFHPHKRTYYHSILPNTVSTSTPEFQAKSKAMDELVAELEGKIEVASEGGGSKAVERMRSKGKKLPRDRLVHYSLVN